jgi:acyl dehydratase
MLNGSMSMQPLDGPPSTAHVYARVIAGASLPGFLWGRGDDIPERGLSLARVNFSAEEIEGFRRVCGGSGPDLPPTMLHVAGFPLAMYLMTGRDFPMGSLGMVHIANRIEVTGQLPALGEYEVQVHAGNARRHPKGTQFDVVTSAYLDGERVWHEASTYLSRGSDLPSAQIAAERSSWPDPTQGAEVVGLQIPADMGRQYAAISGDRNPIHLHPLAAKAFGFRTTIVHGMWTLARCLAEVEGDLPRSYVASAGFFKPVFLPATSAVRIDRGDQDVTVWLTSGDTRHAVVHVQFRD